MPRLRRCRPLGRSALAEQHRAFWRVRAHRPHGVLRQYPRRRPCRCRGLPPTQSVFRRTGAYPRCRRDARSPGSFFQPSVCLCAQRHGALRAGRGLSGKDRARAGPGLPGGCSCAQSRGGRATDRVPGRQARAPRRSDCASGRLQAGGACAAGGSGRRASRPPGGRACTSGGGRGSGDASHSGQGSKGRRSPIRGSRCRSYAKCTGNGAPISGAEIRPRGLPRGGTGVRGMGTHAPHPVG